jgi:pheromone shutdown protein TraB
MEALKKIVTLAAILVFAICLYCFLLGNEVFGGKFSNQALAWYFLAKGIFCSLALYLLVLLLESLKK